ncbi:unnamed protein product [Blepharisma stoltei]|uniref:RING-CH-type domain-containing protein n=1 Tax=Blepharisma stoltei TaxID=1481888 RepID=A0AAU9JA45_9CILI|nr:unnamed protein product [Blepharisma stoltei]
MINNQENLSRSELFRRSLLQISKNNKVLPYCNSPESSFQSIKSNLNSEKLCKICFDSETETHTLIAPCQCSGSVKYIHQECLKVWLVSKNEDLAHTKCELCKTPYIMTYDISVKCRPPKQRLDASKNVVTIILFVLFILVLLILLLISGNVVHFKGNWESVYKSCFYTLCAFFDAVILLAILKIQKESCMENTLSNWKILDYENNRKDTENKYLKAENSNPDLHGHTVYKIPENIMVSGKRVKTPSIIAKMQPIFRNGNISGYSQQFIKSDFLQIERAKDIMLHTEPSSMYLKSCPSEKCISANEPANSQPAI